MSKAATIRNFLRYMFHAGSIVELRALVREGSIPSGKYNDFDQMALAAADLDSMPEVTGVFFTLNPINPAMADKVCVGMNTWSTSTVDWRMRSTNDKDVTNRNLYLIDFDPVRPSGVCSNESEKQKAWDRCARVTEYLRTQGWPEPLVNDSGNGWHAYYRGDGCDAGSPVWVATLKYLSQTFSDEDVKIDSSVSNAARICRLPGTTNKKGISTPDRPHRPVKTVSAPERWETLTYVHLQEFASQHEFSQAAITGPTYSDMPPLVDDAEDQVDQWIDDYEIEVRKKRESNGNIYWDIVCPFKDGAHKGDMKKTSIWLTDRAVCFHCQSDDCEGLGFRDLVGFLRDKQGDISDAVFYEYSEWAAMDDEEKDEFIIDLAQDVWELDVEDMRCPDDPQRIVTIDELMSFMTGDAK